MNSTRMQWFIEIMRSGFCLCVSAKVVAFISWALEPWVPLCKMQTQTLAAFLGQSKHSLSDRVIGSLILLALKGEYFFYDFIF